VPRIHLVSNLPGVSALGDHLRAAGLGPTSARSADALLVLIDRPLDSVEQELLDRARQSVPVLLAGPTVRALPVDSPLVEASGLIPGRAIPPHELALAPGPDGAQVAARMGEFRPVDGWILPDKIADDVERLLFVRHELAEYPVCTWRPSSGLGMFTLGSTPSTLADPDYHRLVGRWLRHALGVQDADPIGVGLLATPTTGAAHQAAVAATEGLNLVAVSGPVVGANDGVRAYDEADDLVADQEVGLVIVATSNNTRAQWASRALEAGKDVVIASPFALSTQEADDLALLAAARSSVVAMYPERRADPAYQALLAAVHGGVIGDVLTVDAVFGEFRRPLGTWRDDERTSGGLIHDRGFGHLDWILDLVDEPVEWVSATSHKRVWHHVTNADHAQVLLRFAGGAEARLVLSDLLATPTTRLDVLGTAGSLLHAAPVSAPEVAALGPLTLATHDGATTRLPSAATTGHAFHRDLADALLSGWPLRRYQVETARKVVAVAEAATRSAAAGGTQITPA
jgi:scyllo-inositol 2-dehydrogenase (NADP+)